MLPNGTHSRSLAIRFLDYSPKTGLSPMIHFDGKSPSRTGAQKPVVGLPTGLVSDKGIGHTTGTRDTANVRFYWSVSEMLLIVRLSGSSRCGSKLVSLLSVITFFV